MLPFPDTGKPKPRRTDVPPGLLVGKEDIRMSVALGLMGSMGSIGMMGRLFEAYFGVAVMEARGVGERELDILSPDP